MAHSYAYTTTSNATVAVFGRNPLGQADLSAFLCRKPLVVNDTTARLASWTASQIGAVA